MAESRVNYTEPCTCGDPLDSVKIQSVYRFVTWYCPTCGKQLANTMVSDSPVTSYYVQKALLIRSNARLREEKGLPPKKTVVTFYDDNGKRILWKDIVAKNTRWEKRMGCVQRKPF